MVGRVRISVVTRQSLVGFFFSPSPEPLVEDVKDTQASADAGRLLRPPDRHPQHPAARWKHFRSQGLRLRRLYGTIALFQCTAAMHYWSVALFLYCIVALLHLEVERARDELKLRVSSLNEPEPVKIALEPASSPSFLPIKMLKFEFKPTSSLLEN